MNRENKTLLKIDRKQKKVKLKQPGQDSLNVVIRNSRKISETAPEYEKI